MSESHYRGESLGFVITLLCVGVGSEQNEKKVCFGFWKVVHLCLWNHSYTLHVYLITTSWKLWGCLQKVDHQFLYSKSVVSQLHNMEIMMKSKASHHTDTHNGIAACFHLQSDFFKSCSNGCSINKCGLYISKGNRTMAAPVLFLQKVYCICFYKSPKFALIWSLREFQICESDSVWQCAAPVCWVLGKFVKKYWFTHR